MILFQHSTFRLLLMMVMFPIWVRVDSKGTIFTKQERTCDKQGGTCVHEDNICPNDIDYPGCDEDEICCTSAATFLNRQSDACENVPCQNKYKGICKTECPNNRIHTGQCNAGCKCCGCKIKPKCRNKHGYCIRKDVDTCDGRKKNKWCIGNQCICCIPTCPETEDCRNASGRCATNCNDNEELNRDISCIRDYCVCCVPKKESCANSTCCQAAGGYCNITCPLGSPEDKTLCEGKNCTCCLPPPVVECPCNNNDDCRSASGHCAHRCDNGERADTSIPCSGKYCVCCVPDCPCKDNRDCESVNGRCDEKCNDHELADTSIPCYGDNCVCCVPKGNCSCSEECMYAKGHCDTCCGRDEVRNDSIPCVGDNCFCCVPRSSCENSSECQANNGHCVRNSNIACEGHGCSKGFACGSTHDCHGSGGRCDTCCKEDEIRNITIPCSGHNCACCVPKNPCKVSCECEEENGRCDTRCNHDEKPNYNATKCQGDNCICCVRSGIVLCPPPFTKVGEECFYRSEMSDSRNWDNARTYCIGIDGDLATPENVPLLREYLADIEMPIAVWIGAHDREVPGDWKYLNGHEIKASDWSTSHGVNQPDNLGSEQCLEIRRYFTPPLNNYYCSRLQGFVCQYGATGCTAGVGCGRK